MNLIKCLNVGLGRIDSLWHFYPELYNYPINGGNMTSKFLVLRLMPLVVVFKL